MLFTSAFVQFNCKKLKLLKEVCLLPSEGLIMQRVLCIFLLPAHNIYLA